MARKPWETPIQYNDDRWSDTRSAEHSAARAVSGDDDLEERDERDIEELLRRGPREERDYECRDTTPINYGRGPHDDEFGVEDRFDTPDSDPVPYGNGPHDDEFGEPDDAE